MKNFKLFFEDDFMSGIEEYELREKSKMHVYWYSRGQGVIRWNRLQDIFAWLKMPVTNEIIEQIEDEDVISIEDESEETFGKTIYIAKNQQPLKKIKDDYENIY